MGCGYNSGMGFVRNGFAAGIGTLPNCGCSGIWFWNVSSTVSGLRIVAPVRGEVPLLRSVAMTLVYSEG